MRKALPLPLPLFTTNERVLAVSLSVASFDLRNWSKSMGGGGAVEIEGWVMNFLSHK